MTEEKLTSPATPFEKILHLPPGAGTRYSDRSLTTSSGEVGMRGGSVLAVAFLLTIGALLGCGEREPELVKLDERGTAILPQERGTKRITPEQVEYLRQKDLPVVLVDSRPRVMHDVEHPAGAISIPLEETHVVAPKLPKEQLIVTLCT